MLISTPAVLRKRRTFFSLLSLLAAALPTAGHAAWPTQGGDAGRRIEVTTLADSGPGSLRAALESPGPRRIVFKVAGEIWLQGSILVREPFVTVAGETAPLPGITLIGDRAIRLRTHDVILRNLRIRVGALADGVDPQNRDGLSIDGSANGQDPAYNILIEHCSLAWSIDELLQIWGDNSHDILVRNSIFAEALRRSIHPKGEHSMGLIVGPNSRNIAVERNLFAHNSARNPVIHGGAQAVVVNNVIYNPGFSAVHFYPFKQAGPTLASVVGNVVIAGPNSRPFLRAFPHGLNPGSKVYYADNAAIGTRTFDPQERAGRLGQNASPLVEERPFWIDGISVMPKDKVLEHVLANAGAYPKTRDALDARIVHEVRTRTGHIRDTPADPRLLPPAAVETRP